jgi:transcriptional regulator with XRE-family HTH domain
MRHSRNFLRRKREQAGLTQVELAGRLDRYQSFVTAYERGQKRIDVIELTEIAEAVGFNPAEAIRAILKK